MNRFLAVLIFLFSVACSSAVGSFSNSGLATMDYSFGNKDIQKARDFVSQGDYVAAEKIMMSFDSDNFTQLVDCLSLNLSEDALKSWLSTSDNKLLANLSLGCYYSHKAWIVRGYEYSNEVPEEDMLSFDEYQDKAINHLILLDQEPLILAEAYARLIRIYMGKGELEQVEQYFKKCCALNNKHFWAYIHYAEAIQPKWLGSVEAVKRFKDALPDDDILKQGVILKLMLDSFISSENYISIDGDLNTTAQSLLKHIDSQLNKSKKNTIQKYFLYNYMIVLSEKVGNQKLLNKYFNLMDEKYTLYPYGIIRD